MKKPAKVPVSRSELVTLYRNAVLHGVPLDEVEKKIDDHVTRLTVTHHVEQERDTERVKGWQLPTVVRLGALLLPISFIVFGMYLVGSAVFPIVHAYFSELPESQVGQLTSPIPQEDVMDVTPLVVTQVKPQSGDADYNSTPRIVDMELDYTNLSNWFDPATAQKLAMVPAGEQEATEFQLDIPKLNLQNATVKLGGSDLNKSLITYPGTAKPGEFGAPVIFGHSVLRQFYNPSEKNPRRYMSIFSTIMTLQKGDEIFVTFDGVKYKYIVQEKTEVKPTDVYILSQQYDAQRLKLVTCTPEGTYLRRGVVTAQLVSGG